MCESVDQCAGMVFGTRIPCGQPTCLNTCGRRRLHPLTSVLYFRAVVRAIEGAAHLGSDF